MGKKFKKKNSSEITFIERKKWKDGIIKLEKANIMIDDNLDFNIKYGNIEKKRYGKSTQMCDLFFFKLTIFTYFYD